MEGDKMYDVIIVGGGISGIYCANLLLSFNSNLKIKVFEARNRLGGRLYSPSGHDMGGSWSWPQSDSYVNAIVKELNIPTIVESPDQIRFLGGSQQIVLKLAQDMITRQNRAKNNVDDNTLEHFISLQEEVISITKKYKDDKDDGDKILCIQTRSYGEEYNNDRVIKDYEASTVILAVPPRLIVSKITFEPPLPVDTREAMEATPTWMAGASKVFLEYSHPFWYSNKSITPSMPFLLPNDIDDAAPVIYDASQSTNGKYAICAFYAGQTKQVNLEHIHQKLIPALEIVFFNDGQNKNIVRDSLVNILFHNWIDDPWTCDDPKSLLLNKSRTRWDDMNSFGNSTLHKPLFENSLYLASTETESESGHIQGALKSAQRVVNQLLTNFDIQK